MKSQLKYIELKSGYADNGPAWIGKVEFSKSGKTMYFNGHAFKGKGHGGCSDIETGEIYWISGLKKDGQDRHWAGNGKIMIARKVIDEYLSYMNLPELDMNKFVIVEIEETDKKKFADIENEAIDTRTVSNRFDNLEELSIDELKLVIQRLKRRESYTNPINGKKFITIQRIEAEELLRKKQANAEE